MNTKLLQQALDALVNSKDLVITDYEIYLENYVKLFGRKAEIAKLKNDIEKHAAAIYALKLAIAQQEQATSRITAYFTRHDEGDMLFFDKDEARRYCDYDLEPEPLVLLSAIAQPEQLANSANPAAVVAEVHMSRYTLEWTNGPLPEGTKLYTIS